MMRIEEEGRGAGGMSMVYQFVVAKRDGLMKGQR